ncbi:MAG: DUF3592 domain-containing protein [Patiriisocius sp.]|uniref:DUF3592 domain-containing protein n=1 Tax=Patiriisocius sp. TaxID=2822396 RepID=UPI003EFA8EFE
MLNNTSPAVKILVLILVTGLFVFSLWRLYSLYKLKTSGETTLATITEYVERVKNPQSVTGSDMIYTPVFRFTTKKGETFTLRASNDSKEKKYAIGEQITIFYPKENPKAAQLDGYLPFKMYFALASIGLVGIIFMIYNYMRNS